MDKRMYTLFSAVIIPALLLSACGTGKVAESKLERISNPDVAASEVEQVVSGNTAFAFDLYQAVRSLDGNVVYSPYSISLAFAMVQAGAKGDTLSQINKALHYTLDGSQPKLDSPAYAGPLALTNSVTLKAAPWDSPTTY